MLTTSPLDTTTEGWYRYVMNRSPLSPRPPSMSPLRRAIRRRVRRGVRFLEANEHRPEVVAFRQRILDAIDESGVGLMMELGPHCVLGKLFGNYDLGLQALGLPNPHNTVVERGHDGQRIVALGFLAPYNLRFDAPETKLNEYYSILTEEWMNEILLTNA
jgi:hypothetical protein